MFSLLLLHFSPKVVLTLGDEVSSSEDEFEKMMKEELNDKMAIHEQTWMAGKKGIFITSIVFCPC